MQTAHGAMQTEGAGAGAVTTEATAVEDAGTMETVEADGAVAGVSLVAAA
jgi:hypothetical protein